LLSLRVSDSLSLPGEAATWVITYVAKRGAGKTYNAADQAEEMLKAGTPIVVLDGMGIWWGLRVASDGKSPGLPVVVFGGEHQDLPLVPEKATEMAKAVVESNISCVLDLSGFSKYAMRKIVMDFLNELYRLNRVERHVFIEESDMFAPQRPIGQDEAFCLSAVDNFVRRGGNHNLGCTLITQRSAVLNKDILTQSDCLVILRTLAPQDKKAIQAWVEEQTDEDKEKLKEWYDSLKALDNGEAWVWHPEKPPIFKKVKFRPRETFHATREFIKSPQASKIVLMGVDDFVERFKKVFKTSPEPEHKGGVPVDAQKLAKLEEKVLAFSQQLEQDKSIIEAYEFGHKIPECIQARLRFLAEVKMDLEKRIKEMENALHDYDDLLSALRRGLRVQNIYDQIHNAEERLAKKIPATLPMDGNIPTSVPTGGQPLVVTETVPEIRVKVDRPVVEIDDSGHEGRLICLAKAGFFDEKRRLTVIAKEIDRVYATATVHHPSRDLNPPLEALVRKKVLQREESSGSFEYWLFSGAKERIKEAS